MGFWALFEDFALAMGNPREWERRKALAAQREAERRRQLEGRWASKYNSHTDKIDVLLDKNGTPTRTYPHVHIAYNRQEDKVRVILSLSPHNHPAEEVLPGDASGNQVNEAVSRMRRRLP